MEDAASIESLKEAVEGLHQCHAKFVRSVDVLEVFEGKTVWDGVVSVFSIDRPDSDTCYVWSSPIQGSERRRFYAVLKKPPIDSAEAAVRAAIVADFKRQNG